MRTPERGGSLAQHYLRWLAALAAAVAAMILISVLALVLLPTAQRSASDLAGLMVLSAQTWVELPPETRPAFEAELLDRHQLALVAGMRTAQHELLAHGFYVRFLEQALLTREQVPVQIFEAPGPDGSDWLWASLTVAGEPIGVGFARERVNTHPLWALALILFLGGILVAATSIWLARRIAQPVARLERAAAQLAAGVDPALLPEAGPRELADLAGHFNQMALQLRDLIEARTTLLAGVSHDLRTPLARMRLALEMLTIQPTPELITRMERDIESMNGQIGQLLTLARGMAPESRQAIALLPWLQDRAGLHETPLVKIQVECPAGLVVNAAPGILARVVDNFLGNAVRHAPGPIGIAVQHVQGAAHSVVRIGVVDQGPGIPPEHLALIWRPFHRVESSRNPATGGHGLGLAIVQQLARAQGWQVGATSTPGAGSSFWVDLPEA